MDFHKKKGEEIEGDVGESKKKGKEKANASYQTKKESGTFHVNYEMDIKKTINLDMPMSLQGLKKMINIAGKDIVGDEGQTNLDSHHFIYCDGWKYRAVNTEKEFKKMQ
jgi:hypothetical protein